MIERGISIFAKYKIYWKSFKNDTSRGFYFQTKPKGGLATNNKKPIYPREHSDEWKDSIRIYHTYYIGTVFLSTIEFTLCHSFPRLGEPSRILAIE